MSSCDNPMITRQINIINCLNDFLPNDVSKLISKYDYYLEGKSFTLNGHTHSVDTIGILSDGRIVSGSRDKTLKIWNLQTGQRSNPEGNCDVTFSDNSTWINSIAILPNDRIVSGTYNGIIKVWNAKTEQCEMTFKSDERTYLISVKENINFDEETTNDLNKPRIISISYNALNNDDIYEIWNMQTGKCDVTYIGQFNLTVCFSVLPDGRVIVKTRNEEVAIWDPEKEKLDTYITERSNDITCVAQLHDGRTVTGSSDGNLQIWSKNKKCDITLDGHSRYVNCVAELPDGRIISGSDDQTLKVWNAITENCDITLEGHTGWIMCIALLPDGRIVSGSQDSTIKIWS
jgi:WD40 repeat protein